MIKSLEAKEILNSKIEPTVKVELKTEKGVFEASVPSGSSTGKHEIKELSSSCQFLLQFAGLELLLTGCLFGNISLRLLE